MTLLPLVILLVLAAVLHVTGRPLPKQIAYLILEIRAHYFRSTDDLFTPNRNNWKPEIREISSSSSSDSSDSSSTSSSTSPSASRSASSAGSRISSDFPSSLRRPSLAFPAINRTKMKYQRLSSKKTSSSISGYETETTNLSSAKSAKSRQREPRNRRRRDHKKSKERKKKKKHYPKYKPVNMYPKPLPTIVSRPHFSGGSSTQLLHSAFKGWGTKEKLVIDVLGNCSSEQRMVIKEAYKSKQGKELSNALSDELSGNFATLCIALVTEDLDFDVQTLNELIENKKHHMCLIGLLARTSSGGLRIVKEKFEKDYQKNLLVTIRKRSEGTSRDVLKSIFSDRRETGSRLDYRKAQRDAEDFLQAVDDKDKKVFQFLLNHLIKRRSSNQVREVCEAYRQIGNTELTESILTMLGNKDSIAYNAFIESCDDSASFFAGCLHKCFQGLGTDDTCLIKIIVSRSEVDLGDIAEAYEELFSVSLPEEIRNETSGDYRKMLLKILGD